MAMIAREELYHLIDELPEGELLTAERFLEYLRDRARTRREAAGSTTEIELPAEQGHVHRMLSPRFVNPEDAEKFRVKVSVLDQPSGEA
jgi:hypothetical protein